MDELVSKFEEFNMNIFDCQNQLTEFISNISNDFQSEIILKLFCGYSGTMYLEDYKCEGDVIEISMLGSKKLNKPQNYVIATGETHSVREFVELSFKEIGIEMEWIGSGIDEVGVEKNNKKRVLVQVNPKYYRDIDIECLIGDFSKAKNELGWEPKMTFKHLVKDMVKAAINRSS
jgi:GDPmannose 4,6-dehydratase